MFLLRWYDVFLLIACMSGRFNLFFAKNTAVISTTTYLLKLVKPKLAIEQSLGMGFAGIWPKPPDGALSLVASVVLL